MHRQTKIHAVFRNQQKGGIFRFKRRNSSCSCIFAIIARGTHRTPKITPTADLFEHRPNLEAESPLEKREGPYQRDGDARRARRRPRGPPSIQAGVQSGQRQRRTPGSQQAASTTTTMLPRARPPTRDNGGGKRRWITGPPILLRAKKTERGKKKD